VTASGGEHFSSWGRLNLSVEQDLYTLVGRYEEFSKQVLNRLDSIDRRLNSGDGRMGNIEQKISQNSTCAFHDQVMESIKNSLVVDQEHSKNIADVKQTQVIQEIKFSARDAAKFVGASSLGSVIVLELIKALAKMFGVALP